MSPLNTITAILEHAAGKKVDRLDRTLIIAHVLDKNRSFVIAHPEFPVSQKLSDRILHFFTLRANGMPLAYILGVKEFYGRQFTVTPDTLIPRPETETMIDAVCNFYTTGKFSSSPLCFIDVGTGSGAIIITLARELRISCDHIFIATDISATAMRVARHNMRTHAVSDMIATFTCDLLEHKGIHQKLSKNDPSHIFICANLPYVDSSLQKTLPKEAASQGLIYEPPSALWSSDDGLAHYKRLITQTIDHKKNNPRVHLTSFYEIDPAQNAPLSRFIFEHSSGTVRTHDDLTQRPRIMEWTL